MTFSDTRFYEKEDELNTWIVKSLVEGVRTNVGILQVVDNMLHFIPDSEQYIVYTHRIFDRFQKAAVKCMVLNRKQVQAAKELIEKAMEVNTRLS